MTHPLAALQPSTAYVYRESSLGSLGETAEVSIQTQDGKQAINDDG